MWEEEDFEFSYRVYKGEDVNEIKNSLKRGELGFNHPNFNRAKQKIHNIDTLLDDNFISIKSFN